MTDLLRSRSLAWHRSDDIAHDAVEGETRLLVVADHDDGFGPGFDREVLGTLEEGCWRDQDGFRLGPIVSISPKGIR